MRDGLEATGDAALVAAVMAGDRRAFGQIYDRYADRLHDFCWSLLRDREEAVDATHDAFLLAAERMGQLRDPARLRPWLYAVARSQAIRRLRLRGRMTGEDGEQEMAAVADPGDGPERAAERDALRRLVWDAAAGLSERDRSLLDLHLRQGLEGADLGEAMGVSASHAYVLLTRVRDQVERALGALLVARMGREDCDELASVLQDWDGRFSPLIRKRVARHVDGCEACGERRGTMVSPLALLSAVPLMPAPEGLRDRVLAGVTLPEPPSGPGPLGPLATEEERPRPSRAALLSLVVLLALLVGGVAAVLLPDRSSSGANAAGGVAGPTLAGPTVPVPTSGAGTTTLGTTTTAAPTTTGAPTTTAAPATTAAPTTTLVPVTLEVSPKTIAFGPDLRRAVIGISNPGRVRVDWEAVASELWFEIEPTGGSIGPGGKAEIVVALASKPVTPAGPGAVLVTWNSGQAEVTVTLSSGPSTTFTTTTLPRPG